MSRLFVFDGDCAFCSSAMRLLRKMTKGRIFSIPFQHMDLPANNLTLDQVQSAVQYLRDGKVLSGAHAIGQYLVDSKTAWAFAGWLIRAPILLSFAEMVYLLVARFRHRLPGGTPECQLRKN